MWGSIRCLVLAAVALAALRHCPGVAAFPTPPRADGLPWYGALSFALAAVVETDRRA